MYKKKIEIKPSEYVVEEVTLEDLLKNGGFDKLIKELREQLGTVHPIIIAFDIPEEEEVVTIGYSSAEDLENRVVRIKAADPDFLSKVKDAVEKVIKTIMSK